MMFRVIRKIREREEEIIHFGSNSVCKAFLNGYVHACIHGSGYQRLIGKDILPGHIFLYHPNISVSSEELWIEEYTPPTIGSPIYPTP